MPTLDPNVMTILEGAAKVATNVVLAHQVVELASKFLVKVRPDLTPEKVTRELVSGESTLPPLNRETEAEILDLYREFASESGLDQLEARGLDELIAAIMHEDPWLLDHYALFHSETGRGKIAAQDRLFKSMREVGLKHQVSHHEVRSLYSEADPEHQVQFRMLGLAVVASQKPPLLDLLEYSLTSPASANEQYQALRVLEDHLHDVDDRIVIDLTQRAVETNQFSASSDRGAVVSRLREALG